MGTPVDPTPEFIQQAFQKASNSPGYPVTMGTPELREAITAWAKKYLGATGEFGVLPLIGSKEFVAWLPTFIEAQSVLYPDVAYPTYLVMQDRTSRGYLEYKATIEAAVDDVDVRIVPVGEAFRLIYLAVEKAGQDPQHPDSLFARLYAADGYHPSRLGSFLAACVFYGVISGNSPKFLEFDVRGRTLAIEGFLVGKAFIDSGFDDYMINKLGPEKWQPEPLTPELVRPLQAFAHAVLYPDDASEPIELPSRAASARPSTKQSGGNSRPGTESTSRPASQASQQQPSLLGRPLGDTSTPAATLQKAAAKIVGLKTLASAKQVMAAAGALAPQSPHAAESDSVSTEAAQGQAESATTDDRRG